MTPVDGDLVDISDGHLYVVTAQPWGYTGKDYFKDPGVPEQNWDAATLDSPTVKIFRKVPDE